MSDAMERVSGWKPVEVTGGHFSRVLDPASQPEAIARWMALVADPSTEQVANLDLLSPDGRLIPVEVSSVGIVDADGTFRGIHGSTRDISERARLERELRASEERYRYLVASSPDLVWLTDAEGTLTFLSDATRTMLGVEPDELIGRPYCRHLRPRRTPRRGGPLPLAGAATRARSTACGCHSATPTAATSWSRSTGPG